jgi:hypothetical protein
MDRGSQTFYRKSGVLADEDLPVNAVPSAIVDVSPMLSLKGFC